MAAANPANFAQTINGEAVNSPTTFAVTNPATEEIVGYAPECTKEQLDQAVAAARTAFSTWSTTPFETRKQVVAAVAGVIAANAKELTALLTSEQGKPLDKAAGDVMGAAYWFTKTSGMTIPEEVVEDSPQRRTIVNHVPIGVCGCIIPWNFPILLFSWKVAPALLTGNTVVVKPSPFTPLTTLRLGELLRGVVPNGVINFISGTDALGPLMTTHAGIDKISFTGSTATGRKVMASASESLKRVTLELGGNDAAIVLADADVEANVKDLFWSAFDNSGQICCATKRMYIHESIYDKTKAALVEFGKTVKVGNGAAEGTQMGPINNKLQFDRVCGFIADSKAQGHTFALGGEVPEGKGFFLTPSLIDNPPEDSRIVAEEQFGPVLPLLKFSDIDDVVRRVNASPWGLGCSIWTGTSSEAISAAVQLSGRIDTGTVWINESLHLSPDMPFGGHKQSGIGSESGLTGLLAYTVPQTLSLKKTAPAAAAAQ